MRHNRSVWFPCFKLLCSIKCPVGCSLVVVSLTWSLHTWNLLRSPMLGSDGIQVVGILYLHVDSLLRNLLLGIDGIRHTNAHDARRHFRSVRRRVLTASGWSVSSVHVKLFCSVHRQVGYYARGLPCAVRRAMFCSHAVSLCSSRALPVCSPSVHFPLLSGSPRLLALSKDCVESPCSVQNFLALSLLLPRSRLVGVGSLLLPFVPAAIIAACLASAARGPPIPLPISTLVTTSPLGPNWHTHSVGRTGCYFIEYITNT